MSHQLSSIRHSSYYLHRDVIVAPTVAPLFNALVGGESLSSLRCPYPSEGQNASTCQILCISVKVLRRYGRFRFSRWRPSAILDFQKLEILTARNLRGTKCVIMPNFVQIGQTVRRWGFKLCSCIAAFRTPVSASQFCCLYVPA